MEMNKNLLQHFEYLLLSNQIEVLKDNYIKRNIEMYNSQILNIDKHKGIISYQNDFYQNNETGKVELSFDKELSQILSYQYEEIKQQINLYITNNLDNYLPFLYHQQVTLQYIINQGNNNIKKFPIILDYILKIQKYLNEKYLYNQDIKINLDLNIVEDIRTPESTTYNHDQIIDRVLGYLKGDNEKREKIMPDEQYNLMISYVAYYVEHDSAPENIQKLESLKISKNLLRFTFWVLHKHLYTTNKIKDNFLHFVKNMLSDFDDWEFSTLKTKFGNRDKVTVNGNKFIPEIIKNELRKGA